MWRENMMTVRISARSAASFGQKRKQKTVKRVGMTTAPSGRYPVVSTTSIPARSDKSPQGGEKRKIAMQVTATPFPPEKPLQKGQLWPSTAPSPAHRQLIWPIARCGSARCFPPNKNRHKTQARTVFRRSPARTTNPAGRPKIRMTFAMPGFPVPNSEALFPVLRRTTNSPVRRHPKK